jgi:hypothetical protein
MNGVKSTCKYCDQPIRHSVAAMAYVSASTGLCCERSPNGAHEEKDT